MADGFFNKTAKFLKKGGQYLSDKLNLEIHDLINAVNKNDTEMVARCIYAGIDPNLQDGINRRALPIAIDNNNTDIIEILLEGKADPNLPGKDGESAIFKAASWRNAAYVGLLMEAGADIYRKGANGISAIDEAKRKGFADILNYMENFKVNQRKEQVQRDQSTHQEIKAKAEEAQQLRAQEAALAAEQKRQQEQAAQKAKIEKIERIYDVPNNGITNALIAAIQRGDKDAVDLFLDKIEDVNQIDSSLNTTPLLSAITYKNTKAVVELIQKGADFIQVVPQQRHSPLTLAVSMNAHKLVQFILEKNTGTDANMLNDPDQLLSPTFLAYKDPKMLDLLLAAGADPYFGGKAGTSPVVKAIEKASIGILPVLAKHQIDLNRNTDGKTLMEWAIQFNRKDWVVGLLREGVSSEAALNFMKQTEEREDTATKSEEE
ncbi:MAG: ankyrin repeat domain-containing protein [Bacteroidota bacterium]